MNKSVAINFVLFQAGWFACVLSAAAYQPWLGVCVALLIVSYHIRRADKSLAEILLIVVSMVIGVIFDSMLLWLNWLDYTSGVIVANTAPVWIVALWALFATTLNVSLRWLRGKWLLAMVFGFVGGPLAYLGGAKLGAVSLLQQPQALIALAIGWAAVTPFLVYLSGQLNGYREHTIEELGS